MAADAILIAQANRSLREMISQFIESSKDGISFHEAGQFALELANAGFSLAAKWANVPGAKKKEWVLEHVRSLLVQIVPMIPLPIWLRPFRSLLAKPFIDLVMALASVTIEIIYRRVSG